MKTRWLLAVLILSGVGAWADNLDTVLTADGFGNIKIGMTPDQIERVLHEKLGYNPYANRGCSLLTTPQLETQGLSVVIDKKVLVRINVDYFSANSRPRAIKTAEGIGLSTSEEDVLKAYGAAAVVKSNPNDPKWHTIFVDSADHMRGLAFETDGATVKSMRAGSYPGLDYESACGTTGR